MYVMSAIIEVSKILTEHKRGLTAFRGKERLQRGDDI